MPPGLDFYSKHYLPTLVNQKNIAYQIMQTSTHWAFFLIGAVLAVVFNSPSFPNFRSLVLTSFVFLSVLHIAIRVAKGYVNQLRWNILERELLILMLDEKRTEAEKEKEYSSLVTCYHSEWQSPVGTGRLAAKVLFQLGFFQMLFGIGALLVYLCRSVAGIPTRYKITVVSTALLLGMAELLVFRYVSEYLKRIKAHPKIKF